MVLFHGLRSMRYLVKGYLQRFIFSKYPTVGTKVLTTRQYIGLRSIDTFNHLNNAKVIEAFEFARWETLASSGFNEKAIRGQVYPVVASTHCNYFQQVPGFCVVTIQTALLGITANGNQIVFVQHMYFDDKSPKKRFKNKLAATAIFHIAIMDWTKGRSMPVRKAFERMGTTANEILLLGDFEMNSMDDFFTTSENNETGEMEMKMNEKLEKLLKDASSDPKNDPSGFVAHDPKHNLGSEESLLANAVATAKITQASLPQRNWFRMERKNKEKKKASSSDNAI